MALTFTMRGDKQILANLSTLAVAAPLLVGDAMTEFLEVELEESQRRVPTDEGDLKATGQVHPSVVRGGNIIGRITYGGGHVDYAVDQHETLRYYHDDGQAKYLASVLTQSGKFAGARIAAGVGRRFAGML